MNIAPMRRYQIAFRSNMVASFLLALVVTLRIKAIALRFLERVRRELLLVQHVEIMIRTALDLAIERIEEEHEKQPVDDDEENKRRDNLIRLDGMRQSLGS